MTTVEAPPATPAPAPQLQFSSSGRKAKNVIATVLMGASFVVVLIPLGFVLANVIKRGGSVLSWEFLTSDIPSQRRTGPGMGPAVVGTIIITLAATVMAVPLGILGAVYLHEYGGSGRFARIVRFMSYVMTGVPSIVMGLFVFTVYTLTVGYNAFGGALALACLMLPVVIRSTEEMLKLVPTFLREASYGVGATKARTIMTVVLPAALPGIVSGCLLAVARAAGETAPLIFTIGIVSSPNWSLFNGANTALSDQIFRNAQVPFVGAQERAYGAALTLVILTFLLTVISRVVAARFSLKR